MFIRFQGAILLGALSAVAGSVLESSLLEGRRTLVRQHYQIEALRERVARVRLRTERLSSLATLPRPIEDSRLEDGRLERVPASSSDPSTRYEPPLLHWRSYPEQRR